MRQWPMERQLIVLGVLLAGCLALWMSREHVTQAVAALRSGDGPERAARRSDRSRAIPVIVAQTLERSDDERFTAIGTGRARNAATLTTMSDGRIVEVLVRAGQRVAKGDILFRIDDEQERLALEIARKRLSDASRLQDRSEYLSSRNVNSNARVEDTQSALEQARLEVLKAEKALKDLTVTAPFSGTVGIPQAKIGDRISAETAMITLDDLSTIEVEFDVPERFVSRFKPGVKLTVETPSYPNRVFAGEISEIDSRFDPESRTVKVRASTPNTDDLLRPGMSFTVSMSFEGETYPAVPELALQWRGGESFVWLVKDGRSERAKVVAVRRLDQMVLVSGPIEVGDLVVVEGVQRLRPGREVSFEQASSAATAGGATAQTVSADKRSRRVADESPVRDGSTQ